MKAHHVVLTLVAGFLLLNGAILTGAQQPAAPRPALRPDFPNPPGPPGGPAAAVVGDGQQRRMEWRAKPGDVPGWRPVTPFRVGGDSFGGPGGFGPGGFLSRSIELFDINGDGALSREEYEAGMREVFDRLDANADGQIDRAELNRDLSTVLVPPATRSRQILRLFDQNNDGKITAEECLLPPKTFAELDLNNSGALESDDLIKLPLSKAALLQNPARRAAALIAELDKNGDKKLSAEEFQLGKAFFQQTDRNGDGLLDADELKSLPPLPADSPQRRAEKMIAQMDQDGDKMLSQNEFQIPGARFEDADANKDGLVDLKELTALFESNRGRPFGPPSGAEMADGILDRFDRNGDGKLTKEELQELPEGLWQKWDLNADGVVEAGELEKALENTRGGLGPIMNPPRGPRPAGPAGAGPRGELLRGNPADIIKKQDQDGDGKLTAAELGVDAKTFQRIDRDGDGKITAEELATAQDLIRPQTPELRNNLREHRRPGNEGKR